MSQPQKNYLAVSPRKNILSRHQQLIQYTYFRCYNCGEFANHLASKCTLGPQPKRCHQCKAEDHLIGDCPAMARKENGAEKAPPKKERDERVENAEKAERGNNGTEGDRRNRRNRPKPKPETKPESRPESKPETKPESKPEAAKV